MFSTRTLTLIYLSREKIVRCDIDPTRRVQRGLWNRPRPVAAEIPTLLEAGLRLSTARPSKVWVLAEDFWTNKLGVAPEVMMGLKPAEIGRALAFEAESLSGQNAVDSELGFAHLGVHDSREDFWVVQIPRWIRDQAEECVRRAGGKLRGLIHPGGLPMPLTAVAAGPWRRVEMWSGVAFGIGVGTDGQLRRTLVAADLRNPAAARGLAQWNESLGPPAHVEQLVDGRRSPPAGGEVPPINLQDDAVLSAWLMRWAQTLQYGAQAMPAIVPPRRPISASQRAAISLAAAAAIGGIALLDRAIVTRKVAVLEQQNVVFKKQTDNLATTKKQITDFDKQIGDLQKGNRQLAAEVPRAEAVVAAYRRRWTELLSAAAEECSSRIVIREIKVGDAEPTIRGVSLGVEPLNAFVADLAARIEPLGWAVSPAYKSIPHLSNKDLMYEFSLSLVESSRPLIQPATIADAQGTAMAQDRP